MTRMLELNVNGRAHRLEVEPSRRLLGVLRDDLGLTGSKYGCGEGRCGACTVLVDGRPVRSCTARVSSAEGASVTTIEGVEGPDGALHPLQDAFLACDALQCGFCTPGMIVSALGLLKAEPEPSDARIVEAMEGNVCRCGTYPRIVEAIRQASAAMKGGPK